MGDYPERLAGDEEGRPGGFRVIEVGVERRGRQRGKRRIGESARTPMAAATTKLMFGVGDITAGSGVAPPSAAR